MSMIIGVREPREGKIGGCEMGRLVVNGTLTGQER
jgi:hypothetical protein